MTKKEFFKAVSNGEEDVLQGKIFAYSDEQRRKSKRQKELADIYRLIEAYPYLADQLPDSIRKIAE